MQKGEIQFSYGNFDFFESSIRLFDRLKRIRKEAKKIFFLHFRFSLFGSPSAIAIRFDGTQRTLMIFERPSGKEI